jgi:hypothetical protein
MEFSNYRSLACTKLFSSKLNQNRLVINLPLYSQNFEQLYFEYITSDNF